MDKSISKTEVIHAFIMVRDISRTIKVKEELINHAWAGKPEFVIYATAEKYNIESLEAAMAVSINVIKEFVAAEEAKCEDDVDLLFLCDALSDHDMKEVAMIALKDILTKHFAGDGPAKDE